MRPFNKYTSPSRILMMQLGSSMNTLAQFSLNNVHKSGLKHHHFHEYFDDLFISSRDTYLQPHSHGTSLQHAL